MNHSRRFRIPTHALGKRVGEEVVILDLSGGEYLSLNPVGSRIWELIEEGRSLAEIYDVVSDEYDAPRETITNDIDNLVRELTDRRLIEEEPSGKD